MRFVMRNCTEFARFRGKARKAAPRRGLRVRHRGTAIDDLTV
jgi:hypothetical protein